MDISLGVRLSYFNNLRAVLGKDEANPAFQMLVKSDNTGTSTDTQFQIAALPGGTPIAYDYDIEWYEDGNESYSGSISNVSTAYTIEFGKVGTFVVKITRDFARMYFNGGNNNGGDKDKLLEIQNWGILPWTSLGDAFEGCSNMNITATDVPDLSYPVTGLTRCFKDCTSLTGGVSNWDVSTITNMTGVFHGCSIFTGDISSWNTSNVTSIDSIFLSASLFNSDVTGWDTSKVTNMDFVFFSTSFNQDISSWNVTSITKAVNMLASNSLSNDNWSNILIGWEAQAVKNDVRVDTGAKYNASAATARQALIEDHNWEINDGGAV